MNENQKPKFLVVATDEQMRDLVAAYLRKHGDVFRSRQSVPDFIQWAKKDAQAVLPGFNRIMVIASKDGVGDLKGLDDLAMPKGCRIHSINEDAVRTAMMKLNEDLLYG